MSTVDVFCFVFVFSCCFCCAEKMNSDSERDSREGDFDNDDEVRDPNYEAGCSERNSVSPTEFQAATKTKSKPKKNEKKKNKGKPK